MWELLHIEGSSPEVGKKRENFFRLLLKYEFGLQVEPAPPVKREWDPRVMVNGEWHTYSLKTTEGLGTIKVAWNGFPSMERAKKDVFTTKTLDKVRREQGPRFWRTPKRSDTNPRRFGISRRTVRLLIIEAKKSGNHVGKSYTSPCPIDSLEPKYWREWYRMLWRLAGYS